MGVPILQEGKNLLFWPLFPQNCIKLKKNGPGGGIHPCLLFKSSFFVKDCLGNLKRSLFKKKIMSMDNNENRSFYRHLSKFQNPLR